MKFLSPSIIQLQVINKNSSEFSTDAQNLNNGRLTLTDHSRSPLAVDYELIETSSRMANGTMRKYVIDKKRSFSCAWPMLPTINSMIVDGLSNANTMKKFYELNSNNLMTLSLFHARNGGSSMTPETYNVFWQSFDYEIVKRYRNFDYWDVSVDFLEA